MPYGIKNETPKMTKKIDEMVAAMVAEGMKEDVAIPIAIDRVKKMRKAKKLSQKTKLHEKLFLADNSSEAVELADKLFKKQVLRYGTWKYGDGVFSVTKDLLEQLVSNFRNVWRNVPITKGHQENQTLEEHPELIAGYVKDLEVDDNGLNAIFDVTDEYSDAVVKKYKDVSAGIMEGYEDHENGNPLGNVLTHIALVVEPYIKNLSPFVALGEKKEVEIVKLTDFEEIDNIKAEEMTEEQKEVIATPEVSTEVTEPVEVPTDKTEVVDVQPEEKSEVVEVEVKEEETKEEAKDQPADNTDVKLSESNASKLLAEAQANAKKLAEQLAQVKAEGVYKQYLSEGKLVPAQKEIAMKLLSAGTQTIHFGESSKSVANLFADFLAKSPAYVSFSENGANQKVNKSGIEAHLTDADIQGFKNLYGAKWESEAKGFLERQGVDLSAPTQEEVIVETITEQKVEESVEVKQPEVEVQENAPIEVEVPKAEETTEVKES